MKMFFTFLIFALTSKIVVAGDFPDQSLLNTIFNKNYNEMARPLRNGDNSVDVQHSLTLLRLVKFENAVLSLDVWEISVWKDERLTWDPFRYDNITSTTTHLSRVWRPDVVLYNSADMEYNHYSKNIPVMLKHNGEVTAVPPTRINAVCKTPQAEPDTGEITCRLVFGSWTQSESQLNLKPSRGTIDISDYIESNVWNLVKTNVRTISSKYDCCTDRYTTVNYDITFKRKYNHC